MPAKTAQNRSKTSKKASRWPKTPHRRPSKLPRALPRGPLEPKIIDFPFVFLAIWAFSPFRFPGAPRRPKRPQNRPKTAQEAPKTAPRQCPDGGPERTFRALSPERLPGGPKRLQEAPKRPQEAPRGPQEAPGRPPRGPKSPPEGSRRPQASPRTPPGPPQEGSQRAKWTWSYKKSSKSLYNPYTTLRTSPKMTPQWTPSVTQLNPKWTHKCFPQMDV